MTGGYVTIPEAVRVVASLLPNGTILMSWMTDEWILGGYASLFPFDHEKGKFDPKRADKRSMRARYGKDWRRTGPDVIRTFQKAAAILTDCVKLPTIKMTGTTDPSQERREIADFERNRDLHIRRNVLATPSGRSPDTDPAFLFVEIWAEDLRREGARLLAKSAGADVEKIAGPNEEPARTSPIAPPKSRNMSEAEMRRILPDYLRGQRAGAEAVGLPFNQLVAREAAATHFGKLIPRAAFRAIYEEAGVKKVGGRPKTPPRKPGQNNDRQDLQE